MGDGSEHGYCGRWGLVHPEKGLRRFLCGHMTCDRPECRHRAYTARVTLIEALIREHGLERFFTLTLDPAFVSGDSAWTYIRQPWSKFRKRMNRRHGRNFKFVAILEAHKTRDVPHIHGFTNVWMHQREWSDMWNDSCGGSVVWVERVDSSELSAYVSKQLDVAKYVGKANLATGYVRKGKLRTLWRSTGLRAQHELTDSSEWRILKENVYDENGQLTWYGQSVERRSNGTT